jgi:hypothetical protein
MTLSIQGIYTIQNLTLNTSELKQDLKKNLQLKVSK